MGSEKGYCSKNGKSVPEVLSRTYVYRGVRMNIRHEAIVKYGNGQTDKKHLNFSTLLWKFKIRIEIIFGLHVTYKYLKIIALKESAGMNLAAW
jgi:hypothetical protein